MASISDEASELPAEVADAPMADAPTTADAQDDVPNISPGEAAPDAQPAEPAAEEAPAEEAPAAEEAGDDAPADEAGDEEKPAE